jgi:hypothetical protein
VAAVALEQPAEALGSGGVELHGLDELAIQQ